MFNRPKATSYSQPLQSAPPRTFSDLSTPVIPDSIFHANDFLLGAGIVIIQPTTEKIVLVHDGRCWFLPKGRKDRGETLEQAALREGYEESGYRSEFLPLSFRTRAPKSPTNQGDEKVTEPLFISIVSWGPRKYRRGTDYYTDPGGEYLTFWYVGQIPSDAIREADTGMPDEKEYVGHLVTYEEAMHHLQDGYESHIVKVAWTTWKETIDDEKVK